MRAFTRTTANFTSTDDNWDDVNNSMWSAISADGSLKVGRTSAEFRMTVRQTAQEDYVVQTNSDYNYAKCDTCGLAIIVSGPSGGLLLTRPNTDLNIWTETILAGPDNEVATLYDICGDGSKIVGSCPIDVGIRTDRRAFIWDKTTLLPIAIPTVYFNSIATCISGNGQLVFGMQGDDYDFSPFSDCFAWAWAVGGGAISDMPAYIAAVTGGGALPSSLTAARVIDSNSDGKILTVVAKHGTPPNTRVLILLLGPYIET